MPRTLTGEPVEAAAVSREATELLLKAAGVVQRAAARASGS